MSLIVLPRELYGDGHGGELLAEVIEKKGAKFVASTIIQEMKRGVVQLNRDLVGVSPDPRAVYVVNTLTGMLHDSLQMVEQSSTPERYTEQGYMASTLSVLNSAGLLHRFLNGDLPTDTELDQSEDHRARNLEAAADAIQAGLRKRNTDMKSFMAELRRGGVTVTGSRLFENVFQGNLDEGGTLFHALDSMDHEEIGTYLHANLGADIGPRAHAHFTTLCEYVGVGGGVLSTGRSRKLKMLALFLALLIAIANVTVFGAATSTSTLTASTESVSSAKTPELSNEDYRKKYEEANRRRQFAEMETQALNVQLGWMQWLLTSSVAINFAQLLGILYLGSLVLMTPEERAEVRERWRNSLSSIISYSPSILKRTRAVGINADWKEFTGAAKGADLQLNNEHADMDIMGYYRPVSTFRDPPNRSGPTVHPVTFEFLWRHRSDIVERILDTAVGKSALRRGTFFNSIVLADADSPLFNGTFVTEVSNMFSVFLNVIAKEKEVLDALHTKQVSGTYWMDRPEQHKLQYESILVQVDPQTNKKFVMDPTEITMVASYARSQLERIESYVTTIRALVLLVNEGSPGARTASIRSLVSNQGWHDVAFGPQQFSVVKTEVGEASRVDFGLALKGYASQAQTICSPPVDYVTNIMTFEDSERLSDTLEFTVDDDRGAEAVFNNHGIFCGYDAQLSTEGPFGVAYVNKTLFLEGSFARDALYREHEDSIRTANVLLTVPNATMRRHINLFGATISPPRNDMFTRNGRTFEEDTLGIALNVIPSKLALCSTMIYDPRITNYVGSVRGPSSIPIYSARRSVFDVATEIMSGAFRYGALQGARDQSSESDVGLARIRALYDSEILSLRNETRKQTTTVFTDRKNRPQIPSASSYGSVIRDTMFHHDADQYFTYSARGGFGVRRTDRAPTVVARSIGNVEPIPQPIIPGGLGQRTNDRQVVPNVASMNKAYDDLSTAATRFVNSKTISACQFFVRVISHRISLILDRTLDKIVDRLGERKKNVLMQKLLRAAANVRDEERKDVIMNELQKYLIDNPGPSVTRAIGELRSKLRYLELVYKLCDPRTHGMGEATRNPKSPLYASAVSTFREQELDDIVSSRDKFFDDRTNRQRILSVLSSKLVNESEKMGKYETWWRGKSTYQGLDAFLETVLRK